MENLSVRLTWYSFFIHAFLTHQEEIHKSTLKLIHKCRLRQSYPSSHSYLTNTKTHTQTQTQIQIKLFLIT